MNGSSIILEATPVSLDVGTTKRSIAVLKLRGATWEHNEKPLRLLHDCREHFWSATAGRDDSLPALFRSRRLHYYGRYQYLRRW